VVIWGLAIGWRPIVDNSFFTHLATGRLIMEDGIPRSDPYSFTVPGRAWVVQSWLASTLWGGVERMAGPRGIHLTIALLSGLLAYLVWRLTRPADSVLVRLAGAGLVLGIGSTVWSARPLLIGLVFFALVLVMLEEPRWHPALLIPLFWLWVNIHGSFPLGVALVVLVLVGRWIDDRRRPDRETALLGFAVVGVLLGALNPLGPRLLTFPVELLGRSDQLRYVIEWQSPDFSSLWARLFLVQIGVAILAIARRPSYRLVVPAIVFVAAALVATRNVALASLVLVPVTAHGAAGFGTLGSRQRLGAAGRVAVVAVAALFAVVAAQGLSGPVYDLGDYPVRTLAWMRSEGLMDEDRRVATEDTVGNFLGIALGRDARTFIDDRYDMYPPEMVEQLADLTFLRPGWDAALDEHCVDVILWEASSPLGLTLVESDDWAVRFTNGSWLVAERRAPLPDC
jgi:hypothetical protein